MLSMKNVTKKYGKKIVLDDVSMDFRKGEITCLLGLNGVGKSTSMKAIMQLIPINKGSITVDGVRVHSNNMNKLAYIPDIPIHDLGWTALQNLEFAKTFYDNFNHDKALKLVKYFKLPTDKKLKELSKGNLARFNLIVGLSQNADYILLDEPFSGIDVFTRESFIKALKTDIIEPHQTVVITTHEIDEVQNIADRIILLEEGKVFRTFSKDDAAKQGLSILEMMRRIYKGDN